MFYRPGDRLVEIAHHGLTFSLCAGPFCAQPALRLWAGPDWPLMGELERAVIVDSDDQAEIVLRAIPDYARSSMLFQSPGPTTICRVGLLRPNHADRLPENLVPLFRRQLCMRFIEQLEGQFRSG